MNYKYNIRAITVRAENGQFRIIRSKIALCNFTSARKLKKYTRIQE
jgi:hypothetical protein